MQVHACSAYHAHCIATVHAKHGGETNHEHTKHVCGSCTVSQGHLRSLVDLRQLVDGVVGSQGHPHCIDGHKLRQAVARCDGEVPAPDCGVDITLLLQVLDACCISLCRCSTIALDAGLPQHDTHHVMLFLYHLHLLQPCNIPAYLSC